MESFDLQRLVDELQTHAENHFGGQILDSQELEENLYISREFNLKAVGLMQSEGQIELPDLPRPIIYDEQTATQTLTLFHYGIIPVLDKCTELQIPIDAKQHISQMVAMEVFSQAKQITALTFGQEKTPSLQVSDEQQKNLIRQVAENHLIHFLGEYERLNGPIDKPVDAGFDDMPIQQAPMQPSTQTASNLASNDDWSEDFEDDDTDSWLDDLKTPPEYEMPLVAPNAPEPAIQPHIPRPTSLTAAHKYAAVALLLNTLTPTLQQRILGHFNANEQMLINSYWQEPDRIAQETDINLVNEHLRQFKRLIEQGSLSLQSTAYRHLKHLAQAYPKADMLSCTERERPHVKQYIESLYADTMAHNAENNPSVALPGKIEEILYHHLHKALSYR